MVAQERELVEKEAEDEEELREVDQAIEEKESILTKLMETVKGFAVIKADYEKVPSFACCWTSFVMAHV